MPNLFRSHRGRQLGLAILILLLLGASGWALLVGPVEVTLAEAFSDDELAQAVVWQTRAPRLVLALLVGAGLAASGAALQGLFRNPLADPALIGVSGGATVGAASAILLFSSAFLPVPFAAMLGGLLATLLVHQLAGGNRAGRGATLLLAGVAINALAGAIVGLLLFFADDTGLRSFTFWTLGSFWGASWASLAIGGTLLTVPLVLFPLLSRALNANLLGEDEARHLGFRPEMIRASVIFLTAMTVGAGVSLAGTIGFVGLVVPHLIRLVFGPDHRFLLPASTILGAALLVIADNLARLLGGAAELPIGALTALAGAPFFLLLLLLRRRAWIL